LKQRYFIYLAFKGTNYYGWQVQNNEQTVQGTLQNAFSLKLGDKISITGAGRTDTGVHANYFVAHFDTDKIIDENFIYQINNFLPDDIAINKIIKVKNDAHARFDAISRTYKYFINTTKNPFNNDYALFISQNLDIQKMNQACSVLFNYEDFTSFSKLHTDTKTNNCKIFEAKWEKTNNQLIFTITANRFLRNMVRAITGTMIDLGRNKITVSDFENIIKAKNRQLAGHSAKAKGLFLDYIKYANINLNL
jgi:tRNA pseudouridine38-40 synthase